MTPFEKLKTAPEDTIVRWTDSAMRPRSGRIVEQLGMKFVEFTITTKLPLDLFFNSDIEEVTGV